MNDEELLEKMTADFVKNLIHNKFDNPALYAELAKRICALINAKVMWQQNVEYNKFLMESWGPSVN